MLCHLVEPTVQKQVRVHNGITLRGGETAELHLDVDDGHDPPGGLIHLVGNTQVRQSYDLETHIHALNARKIDGTFRYRWWRFQLP